MSSVWTRLPALLLPLLAVGCRFSDPDLPPPLDEVLRTGEWSVATQATPQRYRLALAPVRVGFDPRRLYPMDATRHGALPDLKALQRELAQGLGELGVFETVEPRGERESSSAEVAAEAWEANDDLILEVELTDYHQAYLGHSNYVWWFVSYVTYIWPAWFVPVDYYGCGLEARVALRGLQRNSPALLERVLRVVPEEVSRELTPSDRELAGLLDLGALFNLENSLEESNWRAVERWVGSFARRRFVLDLLGQVEEVVGKPLRSGVDSEREAVLSKTRKRLALVVGVSTFADPALGAAPFAAEDAHATAELWSSAPGGALEPNRELTLLVDQAATREAVLSGVAAIASRAGPGDEVLIYFAGHGSSAGGRSQLALYDTEAARLAETSLSLRDLQIALRGVRAQQVLGSMRPSGAQTRVVARSGRARLGWSTTSKRPSRGGCSCSRRGRRSARACCPRPGSVCSARSCATA